MQALACIKQLRGQIRAAMVGAPQYAELNSIDKILCIYENIIIHRGIEDVIINDKAKHAIDNLMYVVDEAVKSKNICNDDHKYLA